MKVLVACEESQTVCKAFRERGHEAYSCDIQEPSGNHPEWHILGDALKAVEGGQITTMDGQPHDVGKWDLLIAHPPCTYLSNAGAVSTAEGGCMKYRKKPVVIEAVQWDGNNDEAIWEEGGRMCYKGARGPHGAKNEADLVTYLISEIKGEFAGRPKIECVDTDGNFYVLLDSFAAGQAIEVLGRYLELLKGGA